MAGQGRNGYRRLGPRQWFLVGLMALAVVLSSFSSIDRIAEQEYESLFESMFHPSSDQSILQQMLPADLQVREYVQEWLKE